MVAGPDSRSSTDDPAELRRRLARAYAILARGRPSEAAYKLR